MAASSKKTYIVEPVNGQAPFEVEATKVEVSETTGRTIFLDGADPVGSYVNINFRLKK